jgi:hypothetical protein
MINDENRLPTTIVGLFNVAGSLYFRRIGLYASLAAIALAVQYVVGVLLPHTDGLVTGLEIIVDSFLVASVSIGVAFDLARKPADWSTIVMGASERWGVVTLVSLVLFVALLVFSPAVYGSPEDTGYGLLIPFVITLWGGISLGQVVAAIEPLKSQFTLPLQALGKGLAVGFRWTNIGRLVLLSVLLALPTLIDSALYDEFTQRHVADVLFWANIPVDALVTGPLCALSTVFYVDFLRRAKR